MLSSSFCFVEIDSFLLYNFYSNILEVNDMRDDYIDIPFGRPYRLTDNSIDKVRVSLAKTINCRVEEIRVTYDRNKGYYFYGPYDICVADLLFEGNDYRGVQIYGGIIEDLKVQLEEERKRVEEETRQREVRERRERQEQLRREQRAKKRKYVLQKYVVPAVAITAGGIIVLTGIGAIHNAVTKEPTGIVQQEQDLNTVANANDLILFAWANHAMGEISEIAGESKYDHVQTMSENLRVDYFTPIMSSYYNYIEEGMLDLPLELTGEAIKTNHNSFRNNAYLFDEELQNRGFGKCSFSNSPFANAIVVDAYGQVVNGSDNGLFGEVYDTKGELITLESDMGYIVYIRAEDVLGNDYGTSNYPEDAIMYKGVAYVNFNHLYDYDAPSMGSK